MKNNSIKKLTFLFLITPFFACLGQEILPSEYNCFSVLIGKDASTEGTLLYGHNDDDGFQLVNYYVVPRKNHPKGTEQTLQ